jgi:hypothetical protein
MLLAKHKPDAENVTAGHLLVAALPPWLNVLLLLLLLQDRLTMLPFLLSFIDYDASPEVYER